MDFVEDIMKKRPVMLIIMDGYGLAEASKGNAVSLAKQPNLERIFKEYDTKTLEASGEAVGLPEGQMGNSEVGHMNIGNHYLELIMPLRLVNLSIMKQ